MRGRNNDPGTCPQLGGNGGHSRGGQYAAQTGISAHRTETGGQCALQHVAGDPGVLSNDDPEGRIGFKINGNCLADRNRHFRCHGMSIGNPANAVRSKQFFHG